MLSYTWDTFRHDCKDLANRVSAYNFTDLVVIERGGIYVENEILKYLSNSPAVHRVKVSFYNGQIRNTTPVVRWTDKHFHSKSRVLVIDDLVDSGSTIEFLRTYDGLKMVESLKFAVLAVKDVSPFKTDFYVKDNVSGWVVFPWEDANGNHLDDASVSHASLCAKSA